MLEGGWKLNPPEPPDGGPGHTAQTDTVNLLQRLQDGAGEVLHFTRNPQVPITNNEAEREVACPKSSSRSRALSALLGSSGLLHHALVALNAEEARAGTTALTRSNLQWG